MLDNVCYLYRGNADEREEIQRVALSVKNQEIKPPGKRQLSKAVTREKLLAAARREFAKKGYHGTSVRELAAAAGVSTGAFYGNFKNKREVFDTIIDEIYATVKSIMDETTVNLISRIKKTPSGKLTSDLVRAVVDKVFRAAMGHTDLFHILRREGLGRDPDFRKQFDRIWDSYVQATKFALQAYVDAGLAKPYDTELVARAVVPMSISMLLHAQRSSSERVNDIVDTVAAMLDGGILRLTSWKRDEIAAV